MNISIREKKGICITLRKKLQTFFVTLLITDVHIDVFHNIEQYDQLVEIFHDMQLMHMYQMQLDFFHPMFNNSLIFNKLKEECLQNNEVQLYLMVIQVKMNWFFDKDIINQLNVVHVFHPIMVNQWPKFEKQNTHNQILQWIYNKLYYERCLFGMTNDHVEFDQVKITYTIENVWYQVNHELVQLIDDQIIPMDCRVVWPLLNNIH